MLLSDISDVAQPVVDQPKVVILAGRLHTAAAVMTAHDYVFDVKNFNRELDDAKAIEIAMHNDIRDVSMNEDFAWLKADDLVCGHATI